MRMQVQSLAPLSELQIWCGCELWYSLQMWLGSGMAVAEAGSCSSDSTPSMGTSICHGCVPKKKKKKKKKTKLGLLKLDLICKQISFSMVITDRNGTNCREKNYASVIHLDGHQILVVLVVFKVLLSTWKLTGSGILLVSPIFGYNCTKSHFQFIPTVLTWKH